MRDRQTDHRTAPHPARAPRRGPLLSGRTHHACITTSHHPSTSTSRTQPHNTDTNNGGGMLPDCRTGTHAAVPVYAIKVSSFLDCKQDGRGPLAASSYDHSRYVLTLTLTSQAFVLLERPSFPSSLLESLTRRARRSRAQIAQQTQRFHDSPRFKHQARARCPEMPTLELELVTRAGLVVRACPWSYSSVCTFAVARLRACPSHSPRQLCV